MVTGCDSVGLFENIRITSVSGLGEKGWFCCGQDIEQKDPTGTIVRKSAFLEF